MINPHFVQVARAAPKIVGRKILIRDARTVVNFVKLVGCGPDAAEEGVVQVERRSQEQETGHECPDHQSGPATRRCVLRPNAA